MNLTLTSMNGNTKHLRFQTKEQILNFIDALPHELKPEQRLKITCDLLGIDGYVQGNRIML